MIFFFLNGKFSFVSLANFYRFLCFCSSEVIQIPPSSTHMFVFEFSLVILYGFPRFPGQSLKILYFSLISEGLLSVVPKDLYSAWISEALLTIIPEDLYFSRISETLLTIVYTDLYFAGISKSLLAGIDLYKTRISKALLAIYIIRISYW